MNVLDLLLKQDINLISQQYLQRRNYFEQEVPDEDEISRGIEKFIETIASKIPVPKNMIIIPVDYFEDGKQQVHADLYKKQDIDLYQPSMTPVQIEEQKARIEQISIDELHELQMPQFPDCYGFSFDKWENVLGYEVYIPENKEEDENYLAALAEDILWEMTFHGMSEEEHDGRIVEIEESLSRAQKNIDEGKTYTWEEVQQRLYEKTGWKDERTQEEKEKAKRKMYIEIFDNAIVHMKALLEYKNSLNE